MRLSPRHALPLLLASIAGCTDDPKDPPSGDPPTADTADTGEPDIPELGFDAQIFRPNVLVVILDDIGIELVGAYDPQGMAAPTPTMDSLAAEGVLFESAYANPWCSPTRATLLTGRYSYRYDIGRAIRLGSETTDLPLEEVTLPELIGELSDPAWDTAVFGKWHLTALSVGALDGPATHGFDWHEGTNGNLMTSHASDGLPQTFEDWERVENGVPERVTGYITTDTVDDAAEWIAGRTAPWFAWLAFHSAHSPWHVPPDDLHTYDDTKVWDRPTKVRAMTEALDTELGRLLDGMDPLVRDRTVVIVVGDNGSSAESALGALEGRLMKSHVYEAGTRVPLIVAGPIVTQPGSRVSALVNSTDLFATIAELVGIDLEPYGLELDSISAVPYLLDPHYPPLREWVYAETFEPNGPGPYEIDQQMVRDERYKLVRMDGIDELYDMEGRWLEGDDLLVSGLDAAQEKVYQRLVGVLDGL